MTAVETLIAVYHQPKTFLAGEVYKNAEALYLNVCRRQDKIFSPIAVIREQCIKADYVMTSLVHVANVLSKVWIQRLNCRAVTMMVPRIIYKIQCK